MKKGMFTFVSCMALDPSLKNTLVLPDHIQWYEARGGTCFKVTHKGDYTFLPNSWSAVYSACMAMKKKAHKQYAPYEVYGA